jgi:hypothetical protein
MKGIVFTTLGQMIEEQMGMDEWNRLVEYSELPSGGAYTAADNYDDAELNTLVAGLAQMTGTPAPGLIRHFGKYALGQFARLYPALFRNHDARSFLKNVHRVIHQEVRKLYPNAELPDFEYQEPDASTLVMRYASPRKLCHFAEGMIDGTADYFGEDIDIEHSSCMHNGDDHCRLELRFI